MKTKIYIKTYNKQSSARYNHTFCDCNNGHRPYAISLTKEAPTKEISKVESIFCASCSNTNLYSKFPQDKFEYVYQSRWMESVPFFMPGYVNEIFVMEITRKDNIYCYCGRHQIIDVNQMKSFKASERPDRSFEFVGFQNSLPMKRKNIRKNFGVGNFFDKDCFLSILLDLVQNNIRVNSIIDTIAGKVPLERRDYHNFTANSKITYIARDEFDIKPDWLNLDNFKNYEIIK